MNKLLKLSIIIGLALIVVSAGLPAGVLAESLSSAPVGSDVAEEPPATRSSSRSDDAELTLEEITNMSLIWENSTVHTGNVWMVRWSPNGTHLVTVGFDGKIVLWNGTTGEVVWSTKGHNDFIRSVAWSPSGTLLATGSDEGIIRLWNAGSGELSGHLTDPTVEGSEAAHMGQITTLHWSLDGKLLASGSGSDSESTNNGDNTIKLWSFPSGNYSANLTAFEFKAMFVQFSPVKANILGVAGDTELRLYNTDTLEITNLFDLNDTAHSISWSPNGSFIASGADNFFVHFFNVNTGHKIGEYYDPEFKRREISWSPRGRFVVETGSGELMKIRAVDNGTIVKVLLGPSSVLSPSGDGSRAFVSRANARCSGNYLPSVSWSPTGRYIATGSAETNTVLVYGDKKFDMVPPRLVAFTPTGTNVPREAVISIKFSEPVSLESFVNAFSITDLFTKWTAADGQLIRLSHGREFIFSPAQRLPPNATIIVNIDNSLKDSSGNTLVGNNHWGFHTIINSRPILSNSFVNPASGDEDAYYDFYTRYLDQDGDAPMDVHAVIDGVPYVMSHHNGTDSDGYYTYRTKLSKGLHSFYFSATDGELDAVSSVGPGSSLEMSVKKAEGDDLSINPFTADVVGGVIILIMILVWFKVVLAKSGRSKDKK